MKSRADLRVAPSRFTKEISSYPSPRTMVIIFGKEKRHFNTSGAGFKHPIRGTTYLMARSLISGCQAMTLKAELQKHMVSTETANLLEMGSTDMNMTLADAPAGSGHSTTLYPMNQLVGSRYMNMRLMNLEIGPLAANSTNGVATQRG